MLMTRHGAVVFAGFVSACAASVPPVPTVTTLVVAQGGDPGALNPAVTRSGNRHPLTDQISNGLVALDKNQNPTPELAETWKIEDDGRSYWFNLRRDLTWHDGVAFTSADVKFTFEQALLKYH